MAQTCVVKELPKIPKKVISRLYNERITLCGAFINYVRKKGKWRILWSRNLRDWFACSSQNFSESCKLSKNSNDGVQPTIGNDIQRIRRKKPDNSHYRSHDFCL